MFVNRGYCDGNSFKSICGQGEIMFLRENRGHVTAKGARFTAEGNTVCFGGGEKGLNSIKGIIRNENSVITLIPSKPI